MPLFVRGRSAAPALLLLAGLVLAACNATAPPTASPAAATPTATASPTPEVTPSPSPEPTTEPTESAEASEEPSGSAAAVDPTEDLTIGGGYELEPLDDASAEAFQTGVSESLGAMGSLIQFGAVTVTEGGEDRGIVLVMAMPDVPGMDDPAIFQSVLQGISGGAQGAEIEQQEIGGETVGLVEANGVGFAGYQDGSRFIFAISQSLDQSTGVVTALIEANS